MLDTQTADKNTQIAGTYVIYSKYFQSFICFIFHLCDDAELIFSWCHYIFVTNVCLRSDLCRNPPHCAALWVNILSLPFLFVYQTDSPSYKAADVVSSSFSITWRKGRKTRTHDLAHIVFSHACCQCTHGLAQTKLEPLLLSSNSLLLMVHRKRREGQRWTTSIVRTHNHVPFSSNKSNKNKTSTGERCESCFCSSSVIRAQQATRRHQPTSITLCWFPSGHTLWSLPTC